MSIAVRGVCCSCLQPQELRARPPEMDADDDTDINMEAVGLRVEAEQYVVASHFVDGSICDGGGNTPQAIVR